MVSNPMHYDVVAFLNRVVATFIGLGFVALCYMAIPFPGADWMTRRLQRLLKRQLRVAAGHRLAEARPLFESAISDLMVQLTGRLAADPAARQRQFEEALVVLETGYALIRLRQLGAVDRALLHAVPAAIARPSSLGTALSLVEARLAQPLQYRSTEIEAALRLLQLGLREWRDLLQPLSVSQPEVTNAA